MLPVSSPLLLPSRRLLALLSFYWLLDLVIFPNA
uniref:Uncharacterized protein n=1 Tax=Arundo donax TaxID=35708 RepID=A0A0A9GLV8_ARUDO